MSVDFLAEMTRSAHRRAEKARGRAEEYRPAHEPALRRLSLDERFGVIAEAKLASPAAGRLFGTGDDTKDVVALATQFERGGASAVSVLTVPEHFHGSLDHLAAVASTVELPVMRKDFLVDPVQVVEAREFGASGVLLVARLLGPERLTEMVDAAEELGMFSLVELFDERDLDTASVVFDRDVLIGVNARDLSDLSIDPDRLVRMAPLLPETLPAVAESGVSGPDDVARLAALGYRMALVGTAIVLSDDPGDRVNELVAAGLVGRVR